LAFCNPSNPAGRTRAARPLSRLLSATLTAVTVFSLTVQPVLAQDISIIRDTEIERVMKSYEDPLLTVAGIDPHSIKMYLIQDPELNAEAAQSPAADEGEDIFVNTGTFSELTRPNQLIGILAHETGHIAGGDLVRGAGAMSKASIPMLIGMAVGLIAMAAGQGQAGMGAIMMGQQAAMAQWLEFSRVQEATADQRGQKFLYATHQSGRGMLEVFQKFANEDAMSAYYQQEFLSDHPADRERIGLLQQIVDASPYKDVPDTPEQIHEFKMIQAKLYGYLGNPQAVLEHYPPSDTSEEARYARAMAYFRLPDLNKALGEVRSLIKEEPNNAYFYEMLGQIYVDMSQPMNGVAPYQKSVDLMPDAPLLRVSLAAAQLATEKPQLAKPALENLKIALQQEDDNSFAWYEAAQAYSQLGNDPMADLSTAERYYTVGALPMAVQFAARAERKLPKGSPDWQRATDILALAVPQGRNRQ
jgi:predicted Zn-dependent protease